MDDEVTMRDFDEFEVRLTRKEMQCIANAMTAFFNRMTEEKREVSPTFANHLMRSMEKFKVAVGGQAAKIITSL